MIPVFCAVLTVRPIRERARPVASQHNELAHFDHKGLLRPRQPQEKQEALTEESGFLLRVFPRERRYAELGYLLPIYLRLAVKTRCVGPSSWHALYSYLITLRTFGYAPVGHGARH